MNSKQTPIAKFEMLIRRPATEVFEAFADPEITSNFWFTKGSSRLEAGKSLEWEWEQFGISAKITVSDMRKNELIRFQWPSGEGENDYRTVDLSFIPVSENSTFVRVVESGFDPKDKQLLETIAGQTGGWALVLSGLKAWLEYEIHLNLIRDHNPN